MVFLSLCYCYQSFYGLGQGDANRKEAELLSYKRRQEQLQNDLMNTSMENRLPIFVFFLFKVQNTKKKRNEHSHGEQVVHLYIFLKENKNLVY